MAVDTNVTEAVDLAVPANTADAGTLHTLIANYKDGIKQAAAVEHSVAVGSEPYLLQHIPGRCGVMAKDTTSNIAALTVQNVNGDVADSITGAIAYDTTLNSIVRYDGDEWETLITKPQKIFNTCETDDSISEDNATLSTLKLTSADATAIEATVTADEYVSGRITIYVTFDTNKVSASGGWNFVVFNIFRDAVQVHGDYRFSFHSSYSGMTCVLDFYDKPGVAGTYDYSVKAKGYLTDTAGYIKKAHVHSILEISEGT